RHTRSKRDWSSDVCSSDLYMPAHDFRTDKYCGKESEKYYCTHSLPLLLFCDKLDRPYFLLHCVSHPLDMSLIIVNIRLRFLDPRSEERRVGSVHDSRCDTT